jgi:hypothetical protein
MSADLALSRHMPDTPSDQALCGFGVSVVPGRFGRSQGFGHPYGTHRSVIEAAECALIQIVHHDGP